MNQSAGNRPRILDLYCGPGGACRGYQLAGWDVVGVDTAPQPRYPGHFVLGDAITYAMAHGANFDAIHASPACQPHTALLRTGTWSADGYEDHIPRLLDILPRLAALWVIENVPGPHLEGITLCGLSFGLGILRHRVFASSIPLTAPEHVPHKRQGKYHAKSGIPVPAGRQFIAYADTRAETLYRDRMECHWMTAREARQAIPPAYTRHIGLQLLPNTAPRSNDEPIRLP